MVLVSTLLLTTGLTIGLWNRCLEIELSETSALRMDLRKGSERNRVFRIMLATDLGIVDWSPFKPHGKIRFCLEGKKQ